MQPSANANSKPQPLVAPVIKIFFPAYADRSSVWTGGEWARKARYSTRNGLSGSKDIVYGLHKLNASICSGEGVISLR